MERAIVLPSRSCCQQKVAPRPDARRYPRRVSSLKLAAPITLCGSLSLHPVGLGAAMHQAGYEALGLPFVYVPFAVERADLAPALFGMRALGIRGFGVSMPFKLDVMPLLDRLSPLAAEIGAVNTIVNEGGVLVGHNTDAEGAARALGEVLELDGARCLVLGAGGAARAVGFGLKARGAKLCVANRTDERGRALASALGAEHLSWADVGARPHAGVAAVVNASSAGMDQGQGSTGSPLANEAVDPAAVYMDIVYRPLDTALLAQARRAGARVVHGGRMLLFQAAAQFELYTGARAPLEAMEAALLREIAKSR